MTGVAHFCSGPVSFALRAGAALARGGGEGDEQKGGDRCTKDAHARRV